jgi:precorrin-6B methylase 2
MIGLGLVVLVTVLVFYTRGRQHRELQRWSKEPELNTIMDRLNGVYAPFNPFDISKQARERAKLYDNAFIYGEIHLLTFAAVLTRVKPQPNEIFYDLGSGSGKAVLLTALLYPETTAIGIEYLTEFIQLAEHCRHHLDCRNAQFIHGDYFNIDFSHADIVFINATALFGDDLIKLRQRLDCVKSGTRIILTSKRLNPQDFSVNYSGQVEMSWGPCSLTIYQKN